MKGKSLKRLAVLPLPCLSTMPAWPQVRRRSPHGAGRLIVSGLCALSWIITIALVQVNVVCLRVAPRGGPPGPPRVLLPLCQAG